MTQVLAKELRDAVLQHAVSGQLTTRNESDTNAYDTFEDIKKHISDLISKKEIKKRKPTVPIKEEELPFEIPDEWVWVRLIDICSKIVDGDHNPPAGISKKTDYMMFSAININNGTIVEVDKCRYLSKDVFETENERTQLEKDDLLFTIVGTLGRSCVYKGGYNACFQRSVAVIKTLINPLYLKIMLDSPYIQQFMVLNATGTAQKGFYLNQVNELLIALPPIEEQARIVARVDELMAEIDEYEKIENRLVELKKNFPGDMKAAVLQAAMQGKLTEQLKSDSSVYETLTKIKKMKDDLFKAKVIKKDIAYEVVEELYDIPDNWAWTHVGEACVYAFNGKSPEYVKTNNGNYTLGQAANQNDGIHFEVSKFCSDSHKNKCDEYQYLKENDTLLNTLGGGSVGRVGIFHNPNNYNCLTDGHIFVFRTAGMVDERYFFYYMKSNQKEFERMAEGSTNQSFLKLPVIKNYPFPLPPIEEQRRIVEKLDQLLPLVEGLTKA